MEQLIINADDFGYCHERNRGIVECFQQEAISHATILVNFGDSSKEAIRLANEHSIPVGLHLNLTGM